MTLIKCPHCSHTVLSVASQCPACHRELGPVMPDPVHAGELAECRACGFRVRSGTSTCPHCGVSDPAGRFRLARFGLWGAAAAGALGLIWLLARPDRDAGTTAESAVTAVAAPTPAPPVQAAPPAERAPPRAVMRAALPEGPVRTRWTASWANVRQGPDTTAPILRTLPPGTRVAGVRNELGWWAVRWGETDSLGYVAGSLLAAAWPPADSAAGGIP